MYSFVRGQKVVTLSSGEAELVALTQTTSEAILIHKAWQWATQETAELVMRSDSSVARAAAAASFTTSSTRRAANRVSLAVQRRVFSRVPRTAWVPTILQQKCG